MAAEEESGTMEGGEGRRVEKKVVEVYVGGRLVGGGGGERETAQSNCSHTAWNTMRYIHAYTLTRNSFICMRG